MISNAGKLRCKAVILAILFLFVSMAMAAHHHDEVRHEIQREAEQKRVSMVVEDALLSEVLAKLATMTGYSILTEVTDSDAELRVTVDLTDVLMGEALISIVYSVGLSYRRLDGNTFLVLRDAARTECTRAETGRCERSAFWANGTDK